MRGKIIYLDNAATTEPDERVLSKARNFLKENYGNASSVYEMGRVARKSIETARKIIAQSLGAHADEIVFTSGGTESNNFAIKGVAFANKNKRNKIITSVVEHKSVLESCRFLEKNGFEVVFLPVDKYGFVNLEELVKNIDKKTILVSVIHGNNEIGTINNIVEIGKICKKYGAYFHTDACQSFTKVKINVYNVPVDLISLNSHKIHGLKGVGALYIRRGVRIENFFHGGSQEMGLRGGTENVAGIIAFAEATILSNKKENNEKMRRLRDKLIEGILKIDGTELNGAIGERRLCNNINVRFKTISGEKLVNLLDLKGICCSLGSACDGSNSESHVLRALGLKKKEIKNSVRFSVSRFNSEEEISYVLKTLREIIKNYREY